MGIEALLRNSLLKKAPGLLDSRSSSPVLVKRLFFFFFSLTGMQHYEYP